MDAYLDALSQLLCCKPPPISELASSHDAKTFHSLIQAGAFGAAGRLGGSAGTPSLADMQQQLYAAAPAGDLPAAMRPRVPESCDMFNVLQQRSGRVRLMRQAAGHAVPRGWRMATCADGKKRDVTCLERRCRTCKCQLACVDMHTAMKAPIMCIQAVLAQDGTCKCASWRVTC
jgi:hypothetical protein